MDFQSLKAFHAVMKEGNVTLAAQRLGVGQPHVSRLIATLERRTGMSLFIRHRGRLLPTEEAFYFQREVERALASVEGLNEVAHDLAAGGVNRQRRLRILLQSHIAHSLIPSVIAQLAANHPSVRIDLDIRQRHTAADWGGQRAFDLAIAALPFEREGVTILPLFRSPACVVLPKGHPLTEYKSIPLRELLTAPLVLLRPGLPKRDRLDIVSRNAGIQLNVACETTSALSAAQIAMAGVAPTIVDPFVARILAGDPRLTIRRTDEILEATYGLAVPTIEVHNPAIDTFRDALISVSSEFEAWFDRATK